MSQNPKENLLLDGVLLVDKPVDWTSHDVCDFVRKRFNIKKVGHAGTLDPLASGLLVLLLGKATKQSNALMASNKTYEGIMELGVETDSHDRKGAVLNESDPSGITLEQVEAVKETFVGEIEQVPPMVSALKHKGVRLYKLARKGKTVEREARPVTVYDLTITKKENEFVYFSAKVSKGTYVRTLVHDMGKALDSYATLAGLRRTRSGNFDIKDAVDVETLRNITPTELRSKTLPLSKVQAHACIG